MKIFVETERLILRELLPSDASSMLALDSNPKVLEFLGIQPTTDLLVCKQKIRFVRDQYERNGIGRWAVVLKNTQKFIGWAGLKFVNEETINNQRNFYDLGYRFIQQFWGNGYGYEAAKASVGYGFSNLKLSKISAYLDARNSASRHILEKCGFQYVNTFLEDELPHDWMEIER